MTSERVPRERRPALAVVLVVPSRFENIHRTLRHLRRQTERNRLEIVLVVPSAGVVEEAAPEELQGFAAVRTVAVGAIDNVDRASAAGVADATAPFVALLEDHAFPEPDWAAHVIAAHAAPSDGVGPAIVNANPGSVWSWANYLLSYGAWGEGAAPGPVQEVPGHNSSFRTELLRSFGDRLGSLLQRDGGLVDALRGQGAALRREPRARVAHVNPSTLRSTSALRFQAGRAWAAARADRSGWSRLHRLAFMCAAPLIPLVRLPRELRKLSEARNGAGSRGRTLAALAVGLTLDAAGQMAGYASGPGSSVAALATFEMDRARHVAARDRALLSPQR